LTYLARRLWQFVPTLLGVVLLVFFLFNWVGGDPAYLLAGKIANPELIENIRRSLGVDQPYWVQLWIFIKQVLSADFGASWSTNERVSEIFATRLGPSLTVLVPLLLISTLLGMAAGMLVASRSSSGLSTIGGGLELEAIAAVVIGGTLLTGGAGGLTGTMVGVLLLGVIQNLINQVGTLRSFHQQVVSGLFLVVVVTAQTIVGRREQS